MAYRHIIYAAIFCFVSRHLGARGDETGGILVEGKRGGEDGGRPEGRAAPAGVVGGPDRALEGEGGHRRAQGKR